VTAIDDIAQRFHTLNPDDRQQFERWSERVLAFQREFNPVYSAFEGYVHLPVEAFKLASVCTFPSEESEAVFQSSATKGMGRSNHYVKSLDVYRRSLLTGFDLAHASWSANPGEGLDQTQPVILGHLPAYADSSSLVYMVNTLVAARGAEGSGLFLDDTTLLAHACADKRPVVLIGAAFGLLDLIDSGAWRLPAGSIVVETGGMKTHRKEMRRADLHDQLAAGLGIGLDRVRSEYGMCELMSQAWSDEDGWFAWPPWVQFSVRHPDRPEVQVDDGTEGILAVFDLANCYSCSAILTEDIAVREADRFRILGRQSDRPLRGCNFLLEEHSQRRNST